MTEDLDLEKLTRILKITLGRLFIWYGSNWKIIPTVNQRINALKCCFVQSGLYAGMELYRLNSFSFCSMHPYY